MNNKPIVQSCRYCTEETGRHIGCHSTCEIYKKFREDIDETNRNRAMYKKIVDDIICSRRMLEKDNPKLHQI